MNNRQYRLAVVLALILLALAIWIIVTSGRASADGPFPGIEYFRKSGEATSTFSPRPMNAARCRVTGQTKGLNPQLMTKLCIMSRRLGPVEVVSGCRRNGKRSYRGQRRSFHWYNHGCKAADVVIPGVRGRTIRDYAKRAGFTGVGTYNHLRAVHVDVRPGKLVTWHW